MIVELQGVSVFGHHGVNEPERRDGQEFLYDVTFELPEPREDSIQATVDYRAVRDVLVAVSDGHAFTLIESLAAAAAEALAAGFPVERVTVRVRKPGIAWAEWAAATVSRSRSS